MPYCEGSSSAVITITLSGNSARVISNAPPVDYTLKELREPGQCYDVNYSIFAWLFIPANGSFQREGLYSFTGRHISTTVSEYLVTTTYQQADGTIRTATRAPYPTTVWAVDRGYELLPTFGVPDACGDIQGCELTVTDQSGVIWRSSGDSCPSVSIQCGSECCPNQQALEAQMGRILARLDQLK